MAKLKVFNRPKPVKMPKGRLKSKDYPPKYKTYSRPRQRRKKVT